MKAFATVLFSSVLATPLLALSLPSNARLTEEKTAQNDRYSVPIAAFDGAQIPVLDLDGAVRRQAWQIPGAGQTTLQMIAPLRSELEDQGFTAILDCIADTCGGFDFRFGIDVLPAPAVYVNLSNFQFLSFLKGGQETPEAAVTLLVSTTRDASYIQIVEVTKSDKFQTQTKADKPVVTSPTTGSNAPIDLTGPEDFLTRGSMVLQGVDFASGATSLAEGSYPPLESLAQFLSDNPSIQIALVGHTDSVGSLDSNIRVSRARARAVKNRLVESHDVSPGRIEAQGAGYLSPIASNLSEAGRAANRRVEAVILRAR